MCGRLQKLAGEIAVWSVVLFARSGRIRAGEFGFGIEPLDLKFNGSLPARHRL